MNLVESVKEFKTKDGRPIRVWYEEHDPDNEEGSIIVYDPNWDVYAEVDGKVVGSGWFTDDHFCGVHVSEKYRRLGIATALYDYMDVLGYYVQPSPNGQEPDGEAFWAARKGEIDEGFLDGGRAPLYHFTNPESARYILELGKINVGAVNGVCTTRDKNFHFNKNPVRIDLDGNKVRHNLKVEPFDYTNMKHSWSSGVERREEREERIYGDVPIGYITHITIFDNGFIFVNDYWKKQTQALIDNAKRLGIPLTVEKQPVKIDENTQPRLHMIEVSDDDYDMEGYVCDTGEEQVDNWLSYRHHINDPKLLDMIQTRFKRVAFLNNLNVAEHARGNGHGNYLLEDFLSEATDQGAEACLLIADINETQNEGFDLVKWYEGYGFKIIHPGTGSGPLMMVERF